MIQQGLLTYLKDDSTLLGLLNATASAQKIYPVQKPKSVDYPVLLITGIEEERFQLLDDHADMVRATFDLDAIAEKQLTAERIREEVRKRLLAFANGGTMGSDTVDVVEITDGNHGYIPPVDATDAGNYVTTLEAEITYREAV